MESEPEQIPANAVWFEPEAMQAILNEFLETYEGVKYANLLMQNAHGDWTVKRGN